MENLELKLIGVIIAVVAAIAVGLVMMGITEVDTSSVESQMPEPTQEMPLTQKDEIISNEHITFLVDPIPPMIRYPDLIRIGIDIAFSQWSQINPSLVFEETTNQNADIHITWVHLIKGEHRGAGMLDCLALGEKCEIIIGLEELNCKNDYLQYDQGKIANILAHETGHALGLLHTLEKNHLMFGEDVYTRDNFDTSGLHVPTRQVENFVGRQPLETQYDSLSLQLEKLNSEYEQLYNQYENFLNEYGLTPETVSNSDDTGESELLTLTVKESVEKLNAKVNAKNSIAQEINLLVDELNCYPDVKN